VSIAILFKTTIKFLNNFRKRSKSKEEGFRLLKRGQKSAAFQRFQKCIDVTPKMAFEVIKVINFPYYLITFS
jgi:hypothetical protein